MKAVILCGGQGTRIRDVNETLPKPMLPIGGKPMVWHIMKGYATYGIKNFILCLGYKGWLISRQRSARRKRKKGGSCGIK